MSALLSPIKDVHSERRLFLGRVILASVISILLLSVVVARLVQLQVVEYEIFAEKSQGNRVRIEPVPPIRGLIFDRNGRVIAENLPAYQLELIPEQVDDIDDTLKRLAALELIALEDIPQFKELSRSGPRFKPVTLKFRMTEEEIANFAIQRPRFPGVDFRPRLVRHYPNGNEVAHVVGYVGALSAADLQRLDAASYAGTSHTGKTGVESSFESDLHGDTGYRHLITNARGRQVQITTSELLDSLPVDRPSNPGANVHLSIDLGLQQIAAQAFEGRRGALVALDPTTGEILALVSAPSFDPNLFAVGMTTSQFRELQDNPDNPLFNRAVRGAYPPGSTIKPILALAALETGATNLVRQNMCHGYFQLPGDEHRYRDWKPEGHGAVDIHEAISQSCDVYFYEISVRLGIDAMHDYLDRFGLGTRTGIDISGEHRGLVPSREWKRNNFSNRDDQRWYHGETVIASIGQGYMLATPLQLASAAGTLATRGQRYRPHIVVAVEDALTGETVEVSPERLPDVEIRDETHWDEVIGAMHDVLQGARGTARAIGIGAPYQMAGKSGTAQVVSIAQDEKYDDTELEERQRDHALFIAFAPLEEPRIAVALIVENGESGSSVAAPIAKQIMDAWLGHDDDAF
ncbi:MAG TPA: penicillin-binding protein 2 [Woeseiaceae bacterium]|jgi:penicillin-binding protein 2|nr:penicillin-binding protein 2 [Woeseiaceae bacterium]